jgi:methylase of polypeptide subunit release factors
MRSFLYEFNWFNSSRSWKRYRKIWELIYETHNNNSDTLLHLNSYFLYRIRGDLVIKEINMEMKKRRPLGNHSTSMEIFYDFINPSIFKDLNNFAFVDMFSGEGNLILPILKNISTNKRNEFFRQSIYLFDLLPESIEKSIENAKSYGISREVAEKNILKWDSLDSFPERLKHLNKPIYHITNPPYLYSGYVGKSVHKGKGRSYFIGDNEKLQDLYQVAMINDLKNIIQKMIYILPSNFLFGSSGTKLIRNLFLPNYKINEAIFFEGGIFQYTGTNVAIFYMERSKKLMESMTFPVTKIGNQIKNSLYHLEKINNFRAGSAFDDFINSHEKTNKKITFNLSLQEINKNPGKNKVLLLDSTNYNNKEYSKKEFFINDRLFLKIKNNPIFIRTLDTGKNTGKAGLYFVKDMFNVDGIFTDGATNRTSPIQVFIEPELDMKETISFLLTFNKYLEELRTITDSDFMTTYRYSNYALYTRKYLGLSQAKKLMEVL